jgi:hypothetical protein
MSDKKRRNKMCAIIMSFTICLSEIQLKTLLKADYKIDFATNNSYFFQNFVDQKFAILGLDLALVHAKTVHLLH